MYYGIGRDKCVNIGGRLIAFGKPVYVYLLGFNKEVGKFMFETAENLMDADRKNMRDFVGEADIYLLNTRDSHSAKLQIRQIRRHKQNQSLGDVFKPVYKTAS